MARQELQALIGNAIISSQFRSELLVNAAQAAASFDLSPEERLFISNIRANTFQNFARQLDAWISDESPVTLQDVPTAVTRR